MARDRSSERKGEGRKERIKEKKEGYRESEEKREG